MTTSDVYDLCNTMVDRDEILYHAIKSKNAVLCVDGTSATKKTSIIHNTGCFNTKIQQLANFKNINSYFPAMLGYITSGILSFDYGPQRLNDRSPLNPLEWHVLWCCMSDYYINYGNVFPENLSKYIEIFNKLKRSYFYQCFNEKINCIAIIDSNCRRCDDVRRRRNHGSDYERSNWKFYTPMQNMMYTVLYDGKIIDLAWFDQYTNTNDVCLGISMWLRDLLREIQSLTTIKIPQLKMFNLPLNFPNVDYALQNFTTHTYRSVGRVGCKIINNECDKKNVPDILETHYLPRFLSVNSIKVPSTAIIYQNKSNISVPNCKFTIPTTQMSQIDFNGAEDEESTNRVNDESDGEFRETEFFT